LSGRAITRTSTRTTRYLGRVMSAFTGTSVSPCAPYPTHSHRREAVVVCRAQHSCPRGAPVPQRRFPSRQRNARGETLVTRVDFQESSAITIAATLTGLALYVGFKVHPKIKRVCKVVVCLYPYYAFALCGNLLRFLTAVRWEMKFGQYTLSIRHPISQTHSIFSVSANLLVTRTVYSQCLLTYWSHVQYILSVCDPIGHT
jgi:hypothetical protein